jgi:serine phosphatase RsbU (regulator of sigma subunit)
MKLTKYQRLIISYILYGFLFGLFFPLLAYVIDLSVHKYSFSIRNIIKIHQENYIHFIIDSAPFVLAFVAYFLISTLVKKEIKLKEQIKKQRDKILDQQKDIIDDIQYSKLIQEAVLPTKEFMDSILPPYFILSMPKSIVSGDFYWVEKHKNEIVIACVDCTGHGISGSFMHMIGTIALNEIINKGNFKTASDILDQLREDVIRALKQTGEEGEVSNGMDITLCIINLQNYSLKYAGAYNPLYIIRNGELQIIEADRMPIGIHFKPTHPFVNHNIEVNEGDMIYLFTDGFIDQFGGSHGKKLRHKPFQQILLDVYTQPVDKQKEDLLSYFSKWKGHYPQIDDVLVMGLKITNNVG